MDKNEIKVAFLSYDGLTDPLGQSQILPYVLGLSNLGYQFTLISFEKPDRFVSHGSQIQKKCNKANIQWLPLTYHKKPPIISTLYDLFVLWNALRKANRLNKFNIIHCRSYLTSIIGLRAKRKWGMKFIFDMRGFWADERVEGGLWNLKNPIYRWIYKFFKAQERCFLIESDAIISLTHVSKEYLIKNYTLAPKKITVINCCVDTDLFDPQHISELQKNDLRKDLGISNTTLVLLYLGSIGTWYMLDEMFSFYNALCNENQDAVFLIITPDSPGAILEQATRNGLNRKRILIRSAERSSVPLYISIAHSSVLFIKPSFSKQASFPTKLGEVLAMELPVILNSSVGDNEFLFNSGNIGVLVRDFNSAGYSFAARQLLSFNDRKHLRKYVLDNFSLKIGVHLFDYTYQDIMG
jgi:glycosyltransferase involved in cell wall biosynthesis